MKKIAGLLLIGYVLLNSFDGRAQSLPEYGLLFSRVRPGGSARIQGMGGASVSLGGDFSSSISNPAGIGMYNRSEFTITPGLLNYSTTSDYMGTSTPLSKSTFQIPGLSLVIHSDKQNEKGFLGGSFAVSYNRLNDFNRSFSYSGTNSNNSIIDFFIQDATGFGKETLAPGADYGYSPTAVAYNNYLIEDSTFLNPSGNPHEYFSALGTFGPGDVRRVFQEETVKTSGAQNQVSFAYGANFNDKLFIGASIGLASIRYQSIKTYKESQFFFESDPTYVPLDNLVLNESLKTNGTGINATLGLIYRPINAVQLGFSYISPTVYALTDSYSAVMTTDWNNFDYNGDGTVMLNAEGAQGDERISDYTLTTPSRINAGATVFIGKYGFITGDVEFVNYPGANFTSSTEGSYKDENAQIKNLYQSTTNFRAGGEFRYEKFRVRGGYSYMPDPYRETQNNVGSDVNSVSGGLGYRDKKFYIDLAAIFTNGKATYRPYTINSFDSPVVNQSNSSTMYMVTVGFPF